MPKISIIIPVYNRAELVKETLDSVIAQTYTDWECVVVDDGSTDNSCEIVRKYIEKDNRFKLFQRPNDRIKGAPSCRNIGYEKSTGELIQFFDSDDLLAPQFFENIVRHMNENPAAEYCRVPIQIFNDLTGKVIGTSKKPDFSKGTLFEQTLKGTNSPNTPNQIWRRSVLDRCEMLWCEGLVKGQDYDFNLRTMSVAKNGLWFDMPPMILIRNHGKQGQKTWAKGKELRNFGKIIADNYIANFYYLEEHNLMNAHIRELFLTGISKVAVYLAAMYGNKEAGKVLNEFFQKEATDFSSANKLKRRVWRAWKLMPLLYFVAQSFYRFKKYYIVISVLHAVENYFFKKG